MPTVWVEEPFSLARQSYGFGLSEDGSPRRGYPPKGIRTPKEAQQMNRMNKQAYSYIGTSFSCRARGSNPGPHTFKSIFVGNNPLFRTVEKASLCFASFVLPVKVRSDGTNSISRHSVSRREQSLSRILIANKRGVSPNTIHN